MQRFKPILIFILLLPGTTLLSQSAPEDETALRIRKSVVQIVKKSMKPDFFFPWKMEEERGSSGSGVIIEGNLILTNAHVAANARYLTVEKEKDPEKYEAQVVFIGHDCDLALLRVANPAFFVNTKPVAVGNFVPDLKSTIVIYGFPMGGTRVSITEGVVSRIEYKVYVHTNKAQFLGIQTDAAINPGNSGGPAIQAGKIIGIAFQSIHGAENLGYTIPAPVINHFLEDYKDGNYDGFPDMGIFWHPLENISYRKFAGLTNTQTGIMVEGIIQGSSADGHLLPNDIILSIEGQELGSDGSITFKNGRVHFGFLSDNKQVGETISMTILRNGKSQKIKFPIYPLESRVPTYSQYDILPRYYIYAGIIFQPLSLDYLLAMPGSDIRQRYLYNYYIQDNLEPEKEEFIMLSSVLKHQVNTYISNLYNKRVQKINNQPITKLEDVATAIKNGKGDFLSIELDGYEKPIILDAAAAKKANTEILEIYDIPAAYRFDTTGWYN